MGLFIFNSSIGKKLIMSITGLALVLFITFHCIMNIFVIISPSDYNKICDFLGANWYAVVGTMGLAFLVVVHIFYAFWLTLQNYVARGKDRYTISKKPAGVDWASQNMLVLGFIIFGFLILHLFNFWYKMQLQQLMGANIPSGADIVRGLFQNSHFGSLICIFYMVWLSAIWFHLTHGIWSAIQTLGGSNHIWLPRIKMIANIYSTIVVLMFMCIPLFYLISNILGLK
jgi:succinate dehydrogenase / fumarate reductase, cytochrome b subunit